jgi:hypothetical protein
MGLKSYFMAPKPQQKSGNKATDAASTADPDESPTTPSRIRTPNNITPWTSRPGSVTTGEEMSDSKCELMVNWLHQKQVERTWCDSESTDEGVVLKKGKGDYACCPESLHEEPEGFRKAVELLNVRVSSRYIVLCVEVCDCADCQ